MSVHIISYQATYSIRKKVLWPQKVLAQVALPEDVNGMHLGKFSQNEQLIGVISIFFDKQILQFKKLAVLKNFRNQGIGSLLLSEVKKIALVHRCVKVICDARQAAVPFYIKHGFKVEYTFLKYEKTYTRMYYDL